MSKTENSNPPVPSESVTVVKTVDPRKWVAMPSLAICGDTGSGKTSLYAGVLGVKGGKVDPALYNLVIFDSGSLQAARALPVSNVKVWTGYGEDTDPDVITWLMDLVSQSREQGRVVIVDGLTTFIEVAIAQMKRIRSSREHLKGFNEIVNRIRDHFHGASLFGSSMVWICNITSKDKPQIKGDDGSLSAAVPAGALATLPALSGLGQNAETILARFSLSLVLVAPMKSKDGGMTGRGFILPGMDWREGRGFSPVKAPACLFPAPVPVRGEVPKWRESVCPLSEISHPPGISPLQVLMERYYWLLEE